MRNPLENQCAALLLELGLITAADDIHATALTGGVASDIAKVTVGNKTYCVKFALHKLKVKADWFAPIQRNRAEYAWLKFASEVNPDGAVELFGQSDAMNGFVMTFINETDSYLWKDNLLAELPDKQEAILVGGALGRIHAASIQEGFDKCAFMNSDDFHTLRIEPYLLHTAKQHTDISSGIENVSAELNRSEQVLIHGDVSPKNIMFRSGHPVILDAECATMGDPSFDVAFCLNHLILKAIHLAQSRKRYIDNAQELWRTYELHVKWEATADFEFRLCRLLPMLMLARVDGKSPVEYLTSVQQNLVRSISRHYIFSPVDQVTELLHGIYTLTTETST